jgi:hypothetical protein
VSNSLSVIVGYQIHQLPSSFTLRRQHFDAALAAVKRLHDDVFPGLLGGTRKPYIADRGGVSGKLVVGSDTLEAALGLWGWVAITDEPMEMPDAEPGLGDIVGLEYVGIKLGFEDSLFAALAPFTEEGSFVSVVGEDYRIWRWFVTGSKCLRQEGHVVYDVPLGEPLRPSGTR